MDSICLKAMAKINLGLDVVKQREDGYHEVRMIMQTIDLYDKITFTKTKEGIKITANREEIPTGEGNLIYKAIMMMQKNFHIETGVLVHLEKNIPMAAGMAGGSTDAAAALVAMNRLFQLNLSEEELMKIGVKIGADVPYCIMGGTALAEGIGEKLTRLCDAPKCFLVIAKPDIDVSTKYVYENLHANTLTRHPDISGIVKAIEEADLDNIAEKLENVLENVTAKQYPIIDEMKDLMRFYGAKGVLMSGSGPTVFGIYDTRQQAVKAAEKLKEKNKAKDIFVSEFVNSTCIEC